MQAYLNEIRPPLALPSGYISPKFYATSQYLENYAISHKGGGRSVFDPYYNMYGPFYQIWLAREDRQEAIAQVNRYKQYRSDKLNNLLNEVSLEDLKFEQDYRGQMSITELALFESLDRSKQLLYLQSAYNATVMSEDLYPPSATDPCSIYNGIGDAYRHALWNALCTVRLGETLTEQLTTAHEEKPFEYPLQSKEKQMDLYNNAKGRELASGAGLVWQLVKTALENGELRYLTSLNSSSNPLERCRATASSLLTPTN